MPVKDIDGLNKDGGYSFRYRIVSKDGNRKSEWSEITTINYAGTDGAFTISAIPLSFYERISATNSPPILAYYNEALLTDEDNYLDPHELVIHPGNTVSNSQPYSVEQVTSFLDIDTYITSSITTSKDSEGVLEYKWGSLQKYADFLQQKFDVYLSFRTEADAWSGWSFAGTTTENTFSFTAPPGALQYVQAAVFISSYPKLDNIYGQETNFISISPPFNVYRNDDGPVTVVAGSAPATGAKYTATISGLTENFPANGWAGRKVYADAAASGGGRTGFPEDTVVRSRASATSFVVEASTAISGTKYNISLVS